MRSDAVYADYCTRFGQSHIGSTGNADVQLRHGSADAGAWKPCIGAWGKYTKLVMQTGAILVVVLGLAMLSQGVGLAGMNPVRISQGSHNTAEFDTAVIAQSGDIQYVESNLDFGTYPEITVYTGIPVKWTINVPEEVINGCNYK